MQLKSRGSREGWSKGHAGYLLFNKGGSRSRHPKDKLQLFNWDETGLKYAVYKKKTDMTSDWNVASVFNPSMIY